MEKIWTEMYEAAKAVLSERRISEYVTCGEVSAAILSKSGKIYTGVCIDTNSTLGICAERRPTILKAINCKNYRKSPGLFKIAERLNVKIKGEQHNALNDAVLLYGVCRELNIQMSI